MTVFCPCIKYRGRASRRKARASLGPRAAARRGGARSARAPCAPTPPPMAAAVLRGHQAVCADGAAPSRPSFRCPGPAPPGRSRGPVGPRGFAGPRPGASAPGRPAPPIGAAAAPVAAARGARPGRCSLRPRPAGRGRLRVAPPCPVPPCAGCGQPCGGGLPLLRSGRAVAGASPPGAATSAPLLRPPPAVCGRPPPSRRRAAVQRLRPLRGLGLAPPAPGAFCGASRRLCRAAPGARGGDSAAAAAGRRLRPCGLRRSSEQWAMMRKSNRESRARAMRGRSL